MKSKNKMPTSSLVMQSLKEELNHLKNESLTKTSIITSNAESHRVSIAELPSDPNQEKLGDSKHELISEKRHTAQKMKLFIKNFFSKCDQIRSFQRIWSHLLKKSLMENSFLRSDRIHQKR